MRDEAERATVPIDPATASDPAGEIGKALMGTALAVAALVAFVEGGRFIEWGAPGELIWPLSPDVHALATFCSVLAVLGFGWLLYARHRRAPKRPDAPVPLLDRTYTAIIAPGALVAGIFAAAGLLVQIAGFAGLRPAPMTVGFEVTAKYRLRGKFEVGYHHLLGLRYGARGRVFREEVGREVYDAASPGDTIPLPVETGRFGLQRAMAPPQLTAADVRRPTASLR